MENAVASSEIPGFEDPLRVMFGVILGTASQKSWCTSNLLQAFVFMFTSAPKAVSEISGCKASQIYSWIVNLQGFFLLQFSHSELPLCLFCPLLYCQSGVTFSLLASWGPNTVSSI